MKVYPYFHLTLPHPHRSLPEWPISERTCDGLYAEECIPGKCEKLRQTLDFVGDGVVSERDLGTSGNQVMFAWTSRAYRDWTVTART
jgi:hypothetical protein